MKVGGKMNVQLGLRVRKQREFLNLTREQLCDFVEISPQFLSEIERGKKSPSSETVIKLCNGLSLSADYLLMGREYASDISKIVLSLENIEPRYVPLAEEHLKIFIKTICLISIKQ